MEIHAEGLGKKFNNRWVFKNFDYRFSSGLQYAIIGPNGSGKSTLLQLLAGIGLPSAGTLSYLQQSALLPHEALYGQISMVAPYLELVEEMTMREFLDFHFVFKRLRPEKKLDNIMESAGIQHSYDKQLKHFSSGMKQRLQLSIAFHSDSEIVFLDEPTSNLDAQGVRWYQDLVKEAKDQLVIIASNQAHEYEHCQHVLNLQQWKS